MTGRTKWLSGLAAVLLFTVLIGGYLVCQQGWLYKRGGDIAAKAANIEVSIAGKVVEVSGTELTIIASGVGSQDFDMTKGEKVKIAVNKKTQYEKTVFDDSGVPTRQAVSRHYVKKNDIVSIDALLGTEASLIATAIIISPRPEEKTGAPMNGYTGGTVINGVVESLKDNGFSVKTENGEALMVVLDKEVNILVASQGQKPKQGTAVDITVGGKISVMGIRQTSGQFLARQIMCVK